MQVTAYRNPPRATSRLDYQPGIQTNMKIDDKSVARFSYAYRGAQNLSQCATQFIGAHTTVAQERHAEVKANIFLLSVPDQKLRGARLSKILERVDGQ